MKRIVLFAALLAGEGLLGACTEELGIGSEQTGVANGDAQATSDGAIVGDGGAPGDGSTGNDSATGDAAPPPVEDGGCGVVLAQEGAVVPIEVLNDAVPQPMGGMLFPGTYALTAYRVHGAGPQGTGNVRETLVLTGTNAVGALKRLSEQSDTTGAFVTHGPLGEHFTFTGDVHSPTIFRTRDCPAASGMDGVEFSFSGTTLVMLDAMTFTERVYTKLR